MRERNLLYLFLALNAALVGAFAIYLFLSTSRQPKIVSTSYPVLLRTNTPPKAVGSAATSTPKTNAPAAAPAATNQSHQATNLATERSPAPAADNAQPLFTQTKFGWQQVESSAYQDYIRSLRAVGCPEDKIRYIVQADINELFAQKRLKLATDHDQQWWRSEPDYMLVNVLRERAGALEDERRALVEKMLGPDALESEKSEAGFWSSVQLTGPVLGALKPDVHNSVQEICARSMERHQSVYWARANEGQALNQVELAQLRQQTRSDLSTTLSAEELEEFLLRYSHNANRLRNELRGFEPTSEEFRKIFRATDPIDHQVQLEFGGVEAMSQQQRARYEQQRDSIIRETLSPERYQAFLLTKDPVYRQAQLMAMQYNAPAKAVMPIYQMAKATEGKRQRILNDASMTPQQKNEALNAVNLEQQRTLQKIVAESSTPR
jgi:hypothetical protein